MSSSEERQALEEKLIRLKQDHADLDAAVDTLTEQRKTDALTIQRLKKKKLALKDQIARIEAILFPDIIA